MRAAADVGACWHDQPMDVVEDPQARQPYTYCNVSVTVDLDGEQLPGTAVGYANGRVTVIVNRGSGMNHMHVVDAGQITRT